MKFEISSPENFWGGIMFVAFGAIAMYVARDYPMGSAMRMGPGYFPMLIGGVSIAGWIVALVDVVQRAEPAHELARDPQHP